VLFTTSLENLGMRAYAFIVIALIGAALVLHQETKFFTVEGCLREASEQQLTCLRTAISRPAEFGNLSRSFDALAQAYELDPTFADSCHGNTHELGKSAYGVHHGGKEIRLSEKASYCGFGFFHGFMEELLAVTNDITEARDFCRKLGGDYEGGKGESACYHGFGHGAMDGSDPGIYGDPVKLVQPALEICALVGDSVAHKNLCASGVFNSLAIYFSNKKFGLIPDERNPYGPCAFFTEDYERRACYDQMNTFVLGLTRNVLAPALALATVIEDPLYAASAVEGLTTFYASFHKHDAATTFEAVAADCHALPNYLREACLKGYGGGLAEFGMPKEEYVHSLAFCQEEVLSDSEVRSCLNRTIPLLRAIYSNSKFETLCDREIKPEFRGLYCQSS